MDSVLDNQGKMALLKENLDEKANPSRMEAK